jgi:WD repeat and SOF domain-containing protein 1
MYDALAANPWSIPFLHKRFEDVVKFKMWNTTEQLDGIPEIKDEWRKLDSLFNAGGNVYRAPGASTSVATSFKSKPTLRSVATATGELNNSTLDATSSEIPEEDPKRKGKGGMYERVGSNSEQEYDRMNVILSDMVRFVLTHRFGGTYLDADTIFLRDWEELWGWKGAFAYRWSRLEKYNTAVLRMHKNSALGSWLFRTALKNDFDFHPMTVSNYAKEAHMEGLLLRLPDALFDSAWLNVEDYQVNRPAFPYFTE